MLHWLFVLHSVFKPHWGLHYICDLYYILHLYYTLHLHCNLVLCHTVLHLCCVHSFCVCTPPHVGALIGMHACCQTPMRWHTLRHWPMGVHGPQGCTSAAQANALHELGHPARCPGRPLAGLRARVKGALPLGFTCMFLLRPMFVVLR